MKIKNITLALSVIISTSLLPSIASASVTTGIDTNPVQEKVKPFICDMYLFSRDPVSGENLFLLDSKKQAVKMFHFKTKTSLIIDGVPLSFPEWKIDGAVKVARQGDAIITSFDDDQLYTLSSAKHRGEVLMISGCNQPK